MAAGRIFVIATDNSVVHVYQDMKILLAAENPVAGASGAVEFFDTRGVRLASVFGKKWELLEMQETTDLPNEQMVQARLLAVMQSLRESVAGRLAAAKNPAATPEQALAKLPELGGRGLAECYALLEPVFGHPSTDEGRFGDRFQPLDDGSWWHNFWCH